MMAEKDENLTEAEKFLKKYPNKNEENTSPKKINYLNPKRVLSRTQYKKYQTLRKSSEKRRYELRIKKLEREDKYAKRQESYARSRSGRFSDRLVTAAKYTRQPTKSLYARYQQVTPQQRMAIQHARAVAMQKQNSQNYYDWCFSNFGNSQFNQAALVESEVNGFNGYAHDGSNQAVFVDKIAGTGHGNVFNQLSKEVFYHSNFSHVIPLVATSINAKRNARNIIRDPINQVSAEANIFSNILP